jgi:hypothetical protein
MHDAPVGRNLPGRCYARQGLRLREARNLFSTTAAFLSTNHFVLQSGLGSTHFLMTSTLSVTETEP